MNTKTKAFTISVIVAAGLALITGSGLSIDSVLAVKTSNSHKSKSSSGTSSSSTSSSSKELKKLIACETTSAKGAGGLSQNQVLNCYSQAFAGNTPNSTIPTSLQGVIAALLIMLAWVLVVLAVAAAARALHIMDHLAIIHILIAQVVQAARAARVDDIRLSYIPIAKIAIIFLCG